MFLDLLVLSVDILMAGDPTGTAIRKPISQKHISPHSAGLYDVINLPFRNEPRPEKYISNRT
jgi:hypothetical protein